MYGYFGHKNLYGYLPANLAKLKTWDNQNDICTVHESISSIGPLLQSRQEINDAVYCAKLSNSVILWKRFNKLYKNDFLKYSSLSRTKVHVHHVTFKKRKRHIDSYAHV